MVATLTSTDLDFDRCPRCGVPMAVSESQTPAARWREKGENDPHGVRYLCDREQLCKGNLTDDELANAVYLDPGIDNLTAAKDRIRWLSRETERLRAELHKALAPTGEKQP